MTAAIMQPYFWPYLGYYQLIRAVDEFVIYDNIQFSKKGWVNRNRILVNGKDSFVTLPLEAGSDFSSIKDRNLTADFPKQADKLLRRLEGSYRKAAYFTEGVELAEKCLHFRSLNLFDFILNSVLVISEALGIKTNILISSTLNVNSSLVACDRVIATCNAIGARSYINPPGGRALYTAELFKKSNLRLYFLNPEICPYPQINTEVFVPNLSIIDMIMNIGAEGAIAQLDKYSLSEQ